MSNLEGLQTGTGAAVPPNVYTGWGADRLRFTDEAEPLLRRILGVLGYEKTDELTTADLVAVIAAWCGLVQLTSSDSTSPTAELWRAMYQAAFTASPMGTAMARREEARVEADAAALALVRRFPPRFEPVDRQALEDLAAMRAALDEQTEATQNARDEAQGLRNIADAAEARAEKAERDLSAAQGALIEIGRVSICPKPKPERVESGQRWAFVMVSKGLCVGDGIELFRDQSGFEYQALKSDMAAAQYLGPAPTVES